MFKMNFRGILGCLLAVLVAGMVTTGCYDDSELRSSINDLKTQLQQLQTLVNTLQNDDAVTGVTPNPDGSYTINFKKSGSMTIRNGKDGENGKNGENGKDGKDGSIVSVAKGAETYTFIFADGTTVILPRYSEVRTLTFEDADYCGPENTTNYWSARIDEPQYGGPILYGSESSSDEVFLGRDFTSKQNYSEDLASKIDKEVRRIIDEAYARGKKMLEEHRTELDRVAGALLELETLDEAEFEAIFTGSKTAAEIAEENGLRAKVRKEKEDKEAEERRKREEEASSKEDEIAKALKEGKRVAFVDRKGNFEILRDMADEFMKSGEELDKEFEDDKDGEPEDSEDEEREEE